MPLFLKADPLQMHVHSSGPARGKGRVKGGLSHFDFEMGQHLLFEGADSNPYEIGFGMRWTEL